MADRGRITITLGRGGQVVKRNGHASDITHTDYMPLAGTGSKRSLRDRLGSSGSQLDNKRQCGADDKSYQSSSDIYIHRDDLRFRTVQPQRASLDVRQHMPEPKETSILRPIPYRRSTEDLSPVDSSRSSYSSWTTDHVKRRSPDGMLGSSRALSPPRRNLSELQRRPLSRSYDVVRSVSFMSRDVPENSLLTCSVSPFMTKPNLPTRSGKPMVPLLGQLPPPGGFVQQRSYRVDMTALKQMGEKDLKVLGIPMGPRKKILLALAHRSKQQQRQM